MSALPLNPQNHKYKYTAVHLRFYNSCTENSNSKQSNSVYTMSQLK